MIAAKEFVVPPSGPRFRKRDKIAFVGQKMVKRVQAAGSYIRFGEIIYTCIGVGGGDNYTKI